MAFDEHPDVVRLAEASPSRSANRVSAVGDPAILVVLSLVVVALTSTATPWAGLGWAALAALFCVGLPLLVLGVMLRRGLVLDRHVVVREQRSMPLAAALVSVTTGLVLLALTSAPRPVVALVAAMLAGAVPMTVISRWWKVSLHVGVAAGTAVVLVLTLGWWWVLVLVPALLAVAWARVRAGRHTVGQVVVGGVIGLVSAATVFPLLR